MNAFLVVAARSFGFPNPSFELNQKARKRLMLVSALPMVIFSAVLVQAALSLVFRESGFSVAPHFFFIAGPIPEFWERVWLVARGLHAALTPLAVATLFAASLRAWSQPEVSWMFAIGLALASAALGLGVFSASAYAVVGSEQALDLRLETWIFLAYSLGFLAIGYFFVAFRALTPGPEVGRYQELPSQEAAAEEGRDVAPTA